MLCLHIPVKKGTRKSVEEYCYLDWAATTPLGDEAAAAMEPYMDAGLANLTFGGNPNSLHSIGRRAFDQLERAHRVIAACLGAARYDEIIFTSGATEANNAALSGIVAAARKQAKQQGRADFVPHIITTTIEHDAVLAYARAMEGAGCAVSYLAPNKEGFIEPSEFQAAFTDNTVLASIQMANNEIGSVQPIAELVDIAHGHGAFFHTDAVQALGKVLIDLQSLGVDAASFSAHKICGPKGVGALYLRTRTPFEPLLIGGGQEWGRRSGTQNVAGAAGFAAACEAACERRHEEAVRLTALRDRLYEKLTSISRVSASVPVAPGSTRYLPNIVNICVEGFESETMILRLDMKGFGVSGGSACSSHSLEPSHVLRALGMSADKALGSLRISFGRYTEPEDVDLFFEAFCACISR